MKLLLNCDQVFEVLTRGPFPTGEPTDEAVEHHLGACHECRQLAEALRPAVALFHEAVSKEESLELPEYQGILPEPDPFENDIRPVDLALQMFVERPRRASQPLTTEKNAWDATRLVNAARLMAASLLVVALGWLAWGLTVSPRYPATASGEAPRRPNVVIAEVGSAPASLDKAGLITLASLKLPPRCLPADWPSSAAAQLAAADALQCCTECHRAGVASGRVARLARFNQACSACHRG